MVRDLGRHRAEQEPGRAGQPLVADDDQLAALLLGDVEDLVGGIALTLIENGIVPVGVAPGTEQLKLVNGGAAAQFAFPVTGGRVSLHPLGGTIDHRGGILFADYKTGKHVEVSNFVIDLSHGDLTGIVNGNPKARVALFTLSLAHAKLAAGRHCLRATGITVDLTAGAAAALNSALGTTLFTGGLDLGTAATSVRF